MAALTASCSWCQCGTLAQAQFPEASVQLQEPAALLHSAHRSSRSLRQWGFSPGARRIEVTSRRRWRGSRSVCAASLSGEGLEEPSAKALENVQEMDKLIDTLVQTDDRKLPEVVAKNIMAFSPKFWLRVALRSDQLTSEDDKADLQDLANKVMRLVDMIAKKSQEKIDDNANVLERILESVADPDTGSWKVPLSKDQVAVMRKEMETRQEYLDDTFLASVLAYLRKVRESNLADMAVLLQRVLQLYAASYLTKNPKGRLRKDKGKQSAEEALLERVIAADEEDWEPILREELAFQAGNSVSEEKFYDALLRRMERSVLYMENGSYQQRVVVEYLKEIERRARLMLDAAKASPPSISQ